ncbi:MAG TPA: DJ-1 family glyoxalase III [Oceanipulchritudo sp.]|nr:DJ-1 family glyoxalase III [Oceanipulchritudo sp.]
MKKSDALVILMDGVEELEAVAPIDCLRRAGVTVTVASASPTLEVTGRNGIHLRSDCGLEECLKTEFELIVIPGGPGYQTLLKDDRVLDLLRQQDEANRLIGSICAGPVVLHEAGVLEGRAFTSFPGTQAQLPQRDGTQKVVRDGHVITSQGAGTAVDFALALVGALRGESVRAEISASICR